MRIVALQTIVVLVVLWFVALLAGIVADAPSHNPAPASVTVESSEEDSATVDYNGTLNRWTVDGKAVPLDCPAEDSCSIDYRNGAWHFTRDTP